MRCNIAILALELSPTRELFLEALIRSLEVQISENDVFDITIFRDVPAAGPLASRLAPKIAVPESCYGEADGFIGLPYWYREQLLALYFAASAGADFSLILPVGSFAIAPLPISSLLPRDRARTHWESVDYHPDWWESAKAITKRLSSSAAEGPSILPAILNCELARWTLDIIRREAGGADPKDALLAAIAAGRNWSAMTLYATASGSRFTRHHHDSWESRTLPLMGLGLWSQASVRDFQPAKGKGDRGLFTYVQTSDITEPDDVLDRLYACCRLDPMFAR